eukprot:s394_g27.t1
MEEVMSMINGTEIGVEGGDAGGADGEEENEGDQPAEAPEPIPEPTDRASFNLLRQSFDNTYAMIELLSLLDSAEVGEKLDMRAIMILENNDDPRRGVLLRRLGTFTKFVMELCHARCWSQLHHCLCLPNAFVRIFVETETICDGTMSCTMLVTATPLLMPPECFRPHLCGDRD